MSEQRAEYKAGDAAIRFSAQVFKFQTLVDGGTRLTLDLIQPADETILRLLQAKQPGVILECAAIAVSIEKQQGNNKDAISERHERKSSWQTAEG